MEWTRWNQTRLALLLRDFRNTEGLRKTLRRSASDPPTRGPGYGDGLGASCPLQNRTGRKTGRDFCRAAPPCGDHESSDRGRDGIRTVAYGRKTAGHREGVGSFRLR